MSISSIVSKVYKRCIYDQIYDRFDNIYQNYNMRSRYKITSCIWHKKLRRNCMKIIDVLLEWTTWLKLLFYQIYKVSKICKKLSHAVARTSGCIWTNKLSVIFYPSFHHSSILLCWLNVSCFIIESLSMKLINLQWKYIFSCLDKLLKKTRLIHNTSEVHPQTFNRNL